MYTVVLKWSNKLLFIYYKVMRIILLDIVIYHHSTCCILNLCRKVLNIILWFSQSIIFTVVVLCGTLYVQRLLHTSIYLLSVYLYIFYDTTTECITFSHYYGIRWFCIFILVDVKNKGTKDVDFLNAEFMLWCLGKSESKQNVNSVNKVVL